MAITRPLLADLNARATAFFRAALTGSAAEAYIKRRGFSDGASEQWQLGYAPDRNVLLRHFASQGVGEGVLIEAGLVKSGDRGTRDFFRDRLILPLPAEDGTILGFGSRRLRDDDDAIPKYLNSPETLLFHKTSVLYGLPNLADIEAAGEAIVVEGNLDMLALWDHGVRNVVASCGTAVTADHLAILAARGGKITLVLDSDAAGIKATRRTLLLSGAEDLDLGVVAIPDGDGGEKRDPDAILAKEGRDAWDSAMATRATRWEYLWSASARPHETAALAGDLEAAIAWVADWGSLVRDHAPDRTKAGSYLARLAKRLGVPREILVNEYTLAMPERSDRDDRCLAALAGDWPARAAYAPYLALGPVARAKVVDWDRRGAAEMGPRLALMVDKDTERRAITNEVRVTTRRLLTDALASTARALVDTGDTDRAAALVVESAAIRSLMATLDARFGAAGPSA